MSNPIYAANPGESFISIGALNNSGHACNNTGLATGAGDACATNVYPNGAPATQVAWGTTVSGGTLTALTVLLEYSVDGGDNWETLDQSTDVAGENRSIPDTGPLMMLRANIDTYTVNAPTPQVTVYIIV